MSLTPVRFLFGRIDRFGDPFAGQSADDRAADDPGRRADWSSDGSNRSAGRCAARGGAYARTNRMRARLFTDGITIWIFLSVFVMNHKKTFSWFVGFKNPSRGYYNNWGDGP